MVKTLEITSLAHGGHGVARLDAEVWFVPYALPGDVVVAKASRRARGVVWGSIESITQPSPYRTAAPCPVFGQCGGCTWLHFAYPAQLEWKRTIVAETLRRLGGIELADINMLENDTLRLGYRTRAEFQSARGKRGFYALGTHDVVNIQECPLCHPRLNAALAWLREERIEGPVEITVNPEGDDVLAWTSRPNPRLSKIFPEAQSLRTEGPRDRFIFDGVPVVCGAFAQGSLLLNRLLRDHVTQCIGGASSVLDLYCGTGNFSLALEAEVLGIDHNRASITAAVSMAKGEYRVGGEADLQAAISSRKWDAIVLDPPRDGAKNIALALAQCDAGVIVYVSCDPATLARDARILHGAGWQVDTAAVVDMFPHTAHIESVLSFKRA
ncbi:MAG TPA: class I SAM-dependent RNA methyltransferase [Candidatus Hydrogenedentes bacterium]|nr:class I SAM-dependent RNA methyltransferase [Candidatus Hydrogenedentota bacterium]